MTISNCGAYALSVGYAPLQLLGHPGFVPATCLINRYQPGTKRALHRSNPVQRLPLQHGDVLVWGGASRMHYHGVNPLKDGHHDLLGSESWNLTFRMARGRCTPPCASV